MSRVVGRVGGGGEGEMRFDIRGRDGWIRGVAKLEAHNNYGKQEREREKERGVEVHTIRERKGVEAQKNER